MIEAGEEGLKQNARFNDCVSLESVTMQNNCSQERISFSGTLQILQWPEYRSKGNRCLWVQVVRRTGRRATEAILQRNGSQPRFSSCIVPPSSPINTTRLPDVISPIRVNGTPLISFGIRATLFFATVKSNS